MAFPSKSFNSSSDKNIDTVKDFYLRNKVLAQNRALAKKNSALMTKITELETKMSELIQENLEYRDAQAKAEDNKRKWLEEKLNIIEEGVSQRFEEIFQMFSNIRANEGLPESKISLNNVLNNTTTPSSDKTVSFESIKSPRKPTGGVTERRRKSSRRQSFYVPSEPENDPDDILFRCNVPALSHPDNNKVELNSAVSSEADPFVEPPALSAVAPKLPSKRQKNNQQDIMEQLNIPGMYETSQLIADSTIPKLEYSGDLSKSEEENIQKHNEKSLKMDVDSHILHSSTLSPIKLSSVNTSQGKLPKLKVYKDKSDQHPQTQVSKMPVKNVASPSKDKGTKNQKISPVKEPQAIENEMTDIQQPLVNVPTKAKHTKLKKRKAGNAFDEEMPEPISSVSTNLRPSRTRNTRVSYVEPSLHKKLRRESEGPVDAVGHKNSFYLFNKPKTEDDTEQIPDTGDQSVYTTPTPNLSKDDVGTRVDLLQETSKSISKSKSNESIEPSKDTIEPETENNRDINKAEAQPKDASILTSTPKETILNKPQLQQKDVAVVRHPEDGVNRSTEPAMGTAKSRTRKPLGSLNQNKLNEKTNNNNLKTKNQTADLSVFDLVEESAVGVPKTYKNDVSVTKRRSSGRRSSSVI